MRPRAPWLNVATLALVIAVVSLLLNAALIAKVYRSELTGAVADVQDWLWPPKELQVTPADHIRGDPNAKLTVIEYGDFQCPYCERQQGVLQALSKDLKMRWVWRQFPLTAIHPMALRAAEASECANDQGHFWDYADGLFQEQAHLSEALLPALAAALHLDVARFNHCLQSGKYRAAVSPTRDPWLIEHIRGTPTFFINGKRHEGLLSYDELKALLTGSSVAGRGQPPAPVAAGG